MQCVYGQTLHFLVSSDMTGAIAVASRLEFAISMGHDDLHNHQRACALAGEDIDNRGNQPSKVFQPTDTGQHSLQDILLLFLGQ